jgi:hypothetical protein
MPGSSTTPGRTGTRAHAPVRVAFRFRNGVSTRDMNLYEAQWLAYVLPYRRFAVALTDDNARLGANVDRYSVIASDLHRLLLAGLPAHCERFWTLPDKILLLVPETLHTEDMSTINNKGPHNDAQQQQRATKRCHAARPHAIVQQKMG